MVGYVPKSGNTTSYGYFETKILFQELLTKDTNVGRTFIKPTKLLIINVPLKFRPVKTNVKGQIIVYI